MKYIVFITIGIIWTIICLITGIITHTVYFVWTFKFEEFYPFEVYFMWGQSDLETDIMGKSIYPVFNRPRLKDFQSKKYKSYFHYIWGIN